MNGFSVYTVDNSVDAQGQVHATVTVVSGDGHVYQQDWVSAAIPLPSPAQASVRPSPVSVAEAAVAGPQLVAAVQAGTATAGRQTIARPRAKP